MTPWIALWFACGGGGPPPPTAPATGCAACHPAEEAPAGVHAFPCPICHLGDSSAVDKEKAHEGLEREPGALDTADRTCGACHPEHLRRVRLSLMTTNAGLLSVDRAAFGEDPAPGGANDLASLLQTAAPTPSEDHARKLCAGCHLGAREANRDDAVQGIGSGCSACHSRTRGAWSGPSHPAIDRTPPDDRCLGCHSRSSRISLSYQGLAEVRGAPCDAPVALHDGRPGCRVDDDVHHAAGLWCVDCHLATELMGDGNRYERQADAVEIRCESCHGGVAIGADAEPPRPTGRGVRGGAIAGIWDDPSRPTLARIGSGGLSPVPRTPHDARHDQPGHERLRCSACHAAWAPQCADCHTTYDPAAVQWDFGAAAEVPGAWKEHAERLTWGPPALGVGADGQIGPAIPGMIATLDATGRGGGRHEVRRFTLVDPHTTGKQARSCVGCHRDPTAMGLGGGEIDWATLALRPATAGPDGLAADRWTTLDAPEPGGGTRPGVRSLSRDEIVRSLRVGLCLGCHPAGWAGYNGFDAASRRVASPGSACTVALPPWARPPG